MDTILRIAGVMAVAYVAVAGLLFVFQRNFIYFPDRTAWSPANTVAPEMEVVRTRTSDGEELISWYSPAPAGRATIVLFHGNGGNIAYRAYKARALIDAGYGILLAGYRGYGGSTGSPSEAGLMRDGEAALAFLGQRGASGANLILYGESLGTGVAVALAGGHEVRALILESPYTSIADVAASAYRIFPARYLVKDRFPSIDRIGAIAVPLLVIHGKDDRVVPVRFGIELFEAAGGPKEIRLIEGAGHNDVFERGGDAVVLEFLARMPEPTTMPEG